jgi:DNA-binding GntR family transcriptional regulator
MTLFANKANAPARLDRNLLKDQAAEALREMIIKGKISPGTKLIERELAEHLGISRMPVQIALTQLEKEGLVVTCPDGHYVIQLSRQDVSDLYKVRLLLERGAAELAAEHTNSHNAEQLSNMQKALDEAVKRKDSQAYIRIDVEMHRAIWLQANNPHLVKALNSMIGPMFMFIANSADHFDWNETLHLHQDLVNSINSGNPVLAGESITRHLDNALHRSMRAFESGY